MSKPQAESPNGLGSERNLRPVVPLGSSSSWGIWVFLGVLVFGGGVLFNVLNASRPDTNVPRVFLPEEQRTVEISSPNPLQVPERFSARRELPLAPTREARQVNLAPLPTGREIPPPAPPVPFVPPAGIAPRVLPAPSGSSPDPRIVFPNRNESTSRPPARSQDEDNKRILAGRFRNPSLTIPQGTVIPAVLETALDSTRPGGARALVQRNISSFDGSKVLIPRGSRLYGEYEANLRSGQNRALVQWSRLIRPDGVTIDLDSPSSDPLGRAGIRGKVDSKFLQRFGNALLQSIVDVGVNVAVSEATDGVILALPGSTQNLQITDPQRFQPTLRIKHGTSVSVFVARDLDFSTVES